MWRLSRCCRFVRRELSRFRKGLLLCNRLERFVRARMRGPLAQDDGVNPTGYSRGVLRDFDVPRTRHQKRAIQTGNAGGALAAYRRRGY